MPQIRANRESVDDRYSVLGFTIRTESPLFEVGIATDPALFQVANKSRRQRSNFYSSRVGGSLRARRGEAVYLLPPQVLSNFVGNPKLWQPTVKTRMVVQTLCKHRITAICTLI